MLDGSQVFLAGVRETAAQPYRYIRIPADADHSVVEFMNLRAALAEPALVQQAASRFAAKNASSDLQGPLLAKAAQSALEPFYKRSEERRVGQGFVRSCWFRWSPYP